MDVLLSASSEFNTGYQAYYAFNFSLAVGTSGANEWAT